MIRILSSLVLALVLALTSQSMAVARGASAATGQIVLCTGAGPVAVYVDAEGQPTGAPHICPDAALNVLMAGAVPKAQVPEVLLVAAVVFLPVADPVRVQPAQGPPPRGPPLMV